ncbi:MAG: molybdopterin-containing oxidoreductase family protein [Lachnospiraceae bacterium]
MSSLKVCKTACGICAPCCPVDAYVKDGKLISVEGSKSRPGQSGVLCSKGMAAKQYVYNKERVLYPMKRVGKKGAGQFERISWEEAYQLIRENLLLAKEQYGPQSVIFYAGYPKWFRPALLRLSNGFGSPNYCTESSTCFQATELAWRSIFGTHICGPDFKNTKALLVWTSNLHHSSVNLSAMYRDLKPRGVKVIVVDSRKTVTACEADIHLQIKPGTDGALALAMANVIISEKLYDQDFTGKYIHGFEEYRDYAAHFTLEKAERITGVPSHLIAEAARIYATTKPAAVLNSASTIVHHVNGVQNQRAIFSLIAITGNYDIPGGNRIAAGPFTELNLNQVHRYDDIEAIGKKEFPVWFDISCDEAQCTKLAEYIDKQKPYPIRAVFAFGLNHRMWPQPDYLADSLKKLDFYVNVELFMSDSSAAADLILPAATSFEREEIKSQPGGWVYLAGKAIEPLEDSKSDFQIIRDTAKILGVKDDVLSLPDEEYMDYILKPSGLTVEDLRKHPEGLQAKNLHPPTDRSYIDKGFPTPTGKAELKSEIIEGYADTCGYSGLPVYHDLEEFQDDSTKSYPLLLNVGARKPQMFHARLYRIPWLTALEEVNIVDIHPDDGKKYGIADGDMIDLETPMGKLSTRARYQVMNLAGVVNIYHGNKNADANNLIPLTYLDPISGFPGYKSYFCRISKAKGGE